MASHRRFLPILAHAILPCLTSAYLLLGMLLAVSKAQVTLDGSLGPRGPLSGPHYFIPVSVGQLRGTNVFHSFDQFNVHTGQSVTFTGPNTVSNILSRVTGGQASTIDGTLRSEIAGANLFLLNPSGVLFGPHATLDVRGSFYVSTADYVRLADGGRFAATLSGSSVLSVAPPVAFGFLGQPPPAAITVERSALQVPVGATLSIVGGDIQVVGNALSPTRNLTAPGGQIALVSVASAGEVIPAAPGQATALQIASVSHLGTIALSQGAFVDAGGDGGGTVVVRGGRLVLDNALLVASARGPIGSTMVGAPGAGIDVQVQADVILTNGAVLGANVLRGVTADAGGVRIRADTVEVSNRADIQSNTVVDSVGNGGNIEITAQSVSVRDRGLIRANAGGSGHGGDIAVHTRHLEVRDGGLISSVAFNGSGNGGNITVQAESILLSNVQTPGALTAIITETDTRGRAGDIRVTTGSMDIRGVAEISTPTRGPGQGGNIDVSATGRVVISGARDPNRFTGIFANTFGSGRGGQLRLTAEHLEMTDQASLQASTFGPQGGAAGGATIAIAGTLELRAGSFITSSSIFGTGPGADLHVMAKDLVISGVTDSTDPVRADFTGLAATTR